MLNLILYVLHLFSEAPSAFLNKESVQREVKAILSNKASLSCEVSDSKTEVKWYKDGKLLTSSRTVHAESKDKSRQLVINSVEMKDAGEYTCVSGSEKLVFRIHVAGKDGRFFIIMMFGCSLVSVKSDTLCLTSFFRGPISLLKQGVSSEGGESHSLA